MTSAAVIDAYNARVEAQTRIKVEARFNALTSYVTSPEREELLDAGVAPVTVRTLFPYSMEELFNAANKAVLRLGLAHLDGSEEYELYRDSLEDVRFSLPDAIYEEIDEEYEAFINLPIFTELFNTIEKRLSGYDSEGRAEAMVASFWHTGYFKLHSSQVPLSEASIDGVFCMVMNWIFPDLVPGDRS